MPRAARSGIHLDEADAAIVKGMIARGDRQHDIAAWFGVNGGRIGEISSGDNFRHVVATTANLPPPGPYLSGRAITAAHDKLRDIRARLGDLVDEVDEQIENLSNIR